MSRLHFEILVEDQSGKRALDILVPKIIGEKHTFRVISYKSVGQIPANLKGKTDPQKRILLDRVPRLLRGYAEAYADRQEFYPIAIIVICDLDKRCLSSFKRELLAIECDSRLRREFCIAIEEGEAWFLGDIPAIKKAFPHAKDPVLNAYANDSICGTWEKLADAVYAGGSGALSKKGGRAIGFEKSVWAEQISPYMDKSNNCSPSFCYFRDTISGIAEQTA